MAFREVSVIRVKRARRHSLQGAGERLSPMGSGAVADGPALHHRYPDAWRRPRRRQEAVDGRADRPDLQAGAAQPALRPRGGMALACHPRAGDQGLGDRRAHRGQDRHPAQRTGIVVPHRTLARFRAERSGPDAGPVPPPGWTTRGWRPSARWTWVDWASSPTPAADGGCARPSSSLPASADTCSSGRPSPRRSPAPACRTWPGPPASSLRSRPGDCRVRSRLRRLGPWRPISALARDLAVPPTR
jgi:hypothetical protein